VTKKILSSLHIGIMRKRESTGVTRAPQNPSAAY